MNSQNFAAWFYKDPKKPLEIAPAKMPVPEPHQIVVKNKAVALNPADNAVRNAMENEVMSAMLANFPYPNILGQDVAGTVYSVGSEVTRFKVGDRVVAQTYGSVTHKPQESGCQHYTAVEEELTSAVPEHIKLEDVAVLPLGLTTAGAALYKEGEPLLHLPPPSTSPSSDHSNGVMVVWGGSSSVGSCAIQLAKQSGCEVYALCSEANFDLVRGLGATKVFDYHDKQIVDSIVTELQNKSLRGVFDAIGTNFEFCVDIAKRIFDSTGSKNSVITVNPEFMRAETPEGVDSVFCSAMSKGTEMAKLIYKDFLYDALASGAFVPAPPARVVGNGLECFEKGLEEVPKVSGQKIVITLP